MGGDAGVGLVNNAGFGVAGFDGGKGGADVFAGYDFGFDGGPEREGGEPFFGIDTGGHGFGISQGEMLEGGIGEGGSVGER